MWGVRKDISKKFNNSSMRMYKDSHKTLDDLGKKVLAFDYKKNRTFGFNRI